MKGILFSKLTALKGWELPKQTSSVAPDYVWTNADQDPVPPERRSWAGWDFVWYWFSDLVTLAGWSAASSVVTTGLSATDAILITFVAALCNAIPTVLNGAIGADLHIPFPIAVRASYGYWLSYFCVISRAILALFWFGVQSAYGAECITAMITAIWPSYQNLPNHLPDSARITSQGMVSFLVYSVVQFPFLLIPTHKLQYLFWVKTLTVVPTALAMVIWISVKAGSAGDFFHEPPTIHGSERAWVWLSSLTSVTGGFSTIAVNIPDFSRFSRTPGSQLWQLPAIPFFKCIVGVFGVVSASAAAKIYGKVLWDPIDIISEWNHSSGGRAAAFFAALVWLLAQICVNISANSVSFANDITTLAPRWFNIRRGVVFAALVGGWAMCPWIIIASAKSLLAFLSAYALFLGPIAGILVTDYWLVKKRRYDVPALYDSRGIYYYQYGVNWRALVTTLVIIVPLLPGMAQKVTPESVEIPVGLQHLFAFNWLFGFCVSIVLYWALNAMFPDPPSLIAETRHATPVTIEGIPQDADIERQAGSSKPTLMADDAKEIGLVAAA